MPNKSDLNKNIFAQYPLTFYFIIAYACSWLVMLPYLRFGQTGLLPFKWPIPFFVSASIAPFAGPFLAAFLLTAIIEGRKGIRKLLKRFVLWRVQMRWYLFVIVGVPAITILGAIFLPGVMASFQPQAFASLLTYPIIFIVMLIIGGPLGEEPGWRGFALPRLQESQGPLVGSLVLGFFWAFWHLPYFWMPEWGTPKEGLIDIFYFVLSVMAVTIVYTWVFNNTKGSLLLVILMHASNDVFFTDLLFTAPVVSDTLLTFVIGFGIVSILLIIFTRGRLGYTKDAAADSGQLL